MKGLIILLLFSLVHAKKSCNGKPYDHVAEFCCINTILPRTHGNAYCCSPKYNGFEHESNSWSGETPVTSPPSDQLQIYNYDTHICCSFTVGSRTFGVVMENIPNGRCCGVNQYNTRREVCLRGEEIIDIPEDNLSPKMCGEQLYDSRLQTCCSDYRKGSHVLHKKLADSHCCRDKLYNDRHQLCCDGIVRARPQNGECCNSVAYNSEERKCCKVGRRSILSEVIDMEDRPAQCCNGKVYSTSEEMCCEGNITDLKDFSVCCGKKSFNNRKNSCCGGVIQERVDDVECCGTKAYNRFLKVCCHGNLFQRPKNAERTFY